MEDYVNTLPDETLLGIFWRVYEETPGLLVPIAAVCKRWKAIAGDRVFIHTLLPHWNVNVLLAGVSGTHDQRTGIVYIT